MKLEIKNLSIEKIDEQIAVFQKKQLLFYASPATEPISLSRKNTSIIINGLFFKASGDFNHEIETLRLSVKLKISINFVLALAILFISIAPFVSSSVQINGKLNPPFAERIWFVAIFIIMISVLYLILLSQKKLFAEKIIRLLS